MTEFWKSNANYWCDICKVWMTDNAATRATHEKGIAHKENVAKKLRQMRQSADAEKKEAHLAKSTMGSIEKAAAAQYARDQEEAERHRKETLGSWEPDAASGYLYNAVHRHYFEPKTGMYYGGDPPAWTIKPAIPAEALCSNDGDRGQGGAEGRTASPAGGKAPVRKVLRLSEKHPAMSSIGGHSMPSTGTIGGAKGVGGAAAAAAAAAVSALKPKGGVQKPKASTKPLSKEDQEAIAKREAARARVQKRTLTSFGLA